jgi:hypothetical protein
MVRLTVPTEFGVIMAATATKPFRLPSGVVMDDY